MTVGGRGPGRVRRLPPVPTARLWQNPALESEDKFDPEGAPARVRDYLLTCGVVSSQLGRLVFAVPGTVDLATEDRSDYTVVKNTPSMSPRFRGFDFKLAFREVCPRAKVSAVPDGLAAALGVACENRQLRSALVLILGTAPAVATLFRDPSGKGRFVEVAIWQSWVWFTKIRLDDPHGYCGGLRVTKEGLRVKPKDSHKIPHHQARIRFALDVLTWERLHGACAELPPHTQPSLSAEAAAKVWAARLQRAVDALAERFHSVYGPPEEVHVLGGNATAARGLVTAAKYVVPESRNPNPRSRPRGAGMGGTSAESEEELWQRVPVRVAQDDATQQQVALRGLLYSSHFKLKQVSAPGQDPLARGWTRGGEIYMYVPKDGRSEKEVSADFVADMASPVEPQQPRCAIAAARRRTAGSSGDGSAST
mmetsp:Transcript_14856/g.47701  ORF Transcript_14856/g.47701 Transcript_14856/m.47701 type:complete len:423 (-) Transcript_14856:60-1328(-)